MTNERALEALNYLNGVVTTMRQSCDPSSPRVAQEDRRIQSHVDALYKYITEPAGSAE